MSSYVLNVLTREEEKDVLEKINQYCPQQEFHIVRHLDLLDLCKKNYRGLTDLEQRLKMAGGIYTNRGFQRLVYLDKRYSLLKKTYGYLIFRKKLNQGDKNG